MTPEERERFERWAKRLEELDAGFQDSPRGAVPYFARLFPVLDTSGLTSAQAEAVLSVWRAKVHAAMVQTQPSPSVPGGTVTHVQPAAVPEAPVA